MRTSVVVCILALVAFAVASDTSLWSKFKALRARELALRALSDGLSESDAEAGPVNIGVVGYSGNKEYDHDKALKFLQQAFDEIASQNKGATLKVVSGWTNLGVPKQAYEEAQRRKWRTVGIACEKAFEYERFPVDEVKVVGKEWGDESPTFLSSINVFVRVGGGKQSMAETAEAKKRGLKVFEFDV